MLTFDSILIQVSNVEEDLKKMKNDCACDKYRLQNKKRHE